jgi:hypothetical protein
MRLSFLRTFLAGTKASTAGKRQLPPNRARFRPSLETLENRCVPAGFLITSPTPGPNQVVQSFLAEMGEVDPSATGAVNPYGTNSPRPAIAVATGDTTGDGLHDTVAAAFRGADGRAVVQLYTINPNGSFTPKGAAFDAGFAEQGRAWVAFGDINGDLFEDLILGTAVDPRTVGSGSIRIFLNNGTSIDASSKVITVVPFADLANVSGVAIRVAAGDLSGNGVAEIAVTTAGAFDVRLAIVSFNVADPENPVPVVNNLGIVDFGFGYKGGAFAAIGRLESNQPLEKEFQLVLSTGNNTFNNPLYGNGRIAAFEFLFDPNTDDLIVTQMISLGTVQPPVLAPNSVGVGFNIAFGTLDPDDGFDQIVLGQLRGGAGVAQPFSIFLQNGVLQIQALGDPVVPINPFDVVPGESTRGTFVAIAFVDEPL